MHCCSEHVVRGVQVLRVLWLGANTFPCAEMLLQFFLAGRAAAGWWWQDQQKEQIWGKAESLGSKHLSLAVVESKGLVAGRISGFPNWTKFRTDDHIHTQTTMEWCKGKTGPHNPKSHCYFIVFIFFLHRKISLAIQLVIHQTLI